MSGDEQRQPWCECALAVTGWRHREGMDEDCQAAFVLMPTWLAEQMPALRGQESSGENAVAYVKWFTPGAQYTWYVTEHDPATDECFGWVDADFPEWGYIDLPSIRDLRYGPGGMLRPERDLYFQPRPVAQIKRGMS